MNNSSTSCVAILQNDEIVKAARLIEQALKNGAVHIRPDRSIVVNGQPLSKLTPTHGVQTSNSAKNKFLFDGNVWTLKFNGQGGFESDRLGLRYVQLLIQKPGEEIHVTELVTTAYGEPVDVVLDKDELLEEGLAMEEHIDDVSGDTKGQLVTTEFCDEILPDESRAFVLDLLEKAKTDLARLKIKGWPDPIRQQEDDIAS